jgi:hypothetical protein
MPEDQELSREAAGSSPSRNRPAAPPYEPDQDLIGYIEKGRKRPSPPDDHEIGSDQENPDQPADGQETTD